MGENPGVIYNKFFAIIGFQSKEGGFFSVFLSFRGLKGYSQKMFENQMAKNLETPKRKNPGI